MSLLEQRDSDICTAHPDERLKLICLTDNTKICCECAKHKDHKNHRIKKIKQLKAQGAKVKGDLEENLLGIRTYKQNKENDCENVRKLFIKSIDEQFNEIQEILHYKQFELIQQVNNLCDANKKNGSEGIFALKQQMGETIKNITHACNNKNGDLALLDKAIRNDQILVKSQLLKEKPFTVCNKVLDMQEILKSSIDASKIAISSLQLPSQELIKETFILPKGEAEEELAKIQKNLKTIKFNSYFDIDMTSKDLKISTERQNPKLIEIDRDEVKKFETIEIQFKRYDRLEQEPNRTVVSYIFRVLENFTSVKVSWDPIGFSEPSLDWFREKISEHVPRLKSLSLDFEKCGIFMNILCDRILSKITNLRDLYLYLNFSQIDSRKLERLVNTLRPFQKNFECFALGLANNPLKNNSINQVFEIIKNMEALKNLQLILSGTRITNRSFEIFGESVLPHLKALDSLTLFADRTQISDQGILLVLKNLPSSLKRLELYLSQTIITNRTLETFLVETLPRLVSLESLTFIVNNILVSQDSLQKIHNISESLKRKNGGDVAGERF